MPNQYGLLNENEVINAVCAELERRSFRVLEKRSTRQRGIDIRAAFPNDNGELWIEAKGATSADPESNRYDTEGGFDSSQRRDHMANAIYSALRHLSSGNPPRRVAIALPAEHRSQVVDPVLHALKTLGIAVFLVDHGASVELLGDVD